VYDNESRMWAEGVGEGPTVASRRENFGVHGTEDVSYALFGSLADGLR